MFYEDEMARSFHHLGLVKHRYETSNNYFQQRARILTLSSHGGSPSKFYPFFTHLFWSLLLHIALSGRSSL
jgi:hypothetical protein